MTPAAAMLDTRGVGVLRRLALIAAIVCALPTPAADAAPAPIADYSLVTGDDYPPYADKKLPGGGLALQIVREAFAAVGRTVDIGVLPWTRGYVVAQEGKVDGTFPYVPTRERLLGMVSSQPMAKVIDRMWSASDRPIRRFSRETIMGKRICVPLGYALLDTAKLMVERHELTITIPLTLANCLSMIAGHRADFVIADPIIMHAVERQAGVMLTPGDSIVETRDLVVLAPKNGAKSAAMLADFNEGLAKIKANGHYQQLIGNTDWP